MMEGCLLDVDNGYIYTAVQAEAVGKIIRPTFVIEDKDAITAARTKAVAEFGVEVVKRMRTMAAGPQYGSDTNAAPDAAWKKAAGPALVSDINPKGATIGLTPAGFHAPDLDVPVRRP